MAQWPNLEELHLTNKVHNKEINEQRISGNTRTEQDSNLKRPDKTSTMTTKLNIEYVYSVAVYKKYLTRLRELIVFESWQENYHFYQPS